MKSLLALARRRAGQARRGRLRPASRLKRHTHSIIQHIQLSTNKCIHLIFKLKALNQPEGGLQCPQLPLSCHRHVAQHAAAALEIFCQQVVIVWSRGSLGATWRRSVCPQTSSGLIKIHRCVPRRKSRGGWRWLRRRLRPATDASQGPPAGQVQSAVSLGGPACVAVPARGAPRGLS